MSNPKLGGDEQKPDMRRDAPWVSERVTAKLSIFGWGHIVNPASMQGRYP